MTSQETQHSQDNPSGLAGVMTRALNRLLTYDPKTRKKLAPLAGKKVRLNIQPVNQSLVLVIHEDQITVSTDPDMDVDTTISGKPTALFAMSTNQHVPGLDGVNIQGDASTGQYVAELLKQIQPDWEDLWCDLLGETPGYHVAKLFHGAQQAGSKLLNSLRDSSKEYLLEENRELISPREMDDFLDQVDDLRADVDRLEQTINNLKNNHP